MVTTADPAERRYRSSLAAGAGIQPGTFDHPATIVLPESSRAGWGFAAAYHVNRATVIRVDPDLAHMVAELAHPTHAHQTDHLQRWANDRRWNFVTGGDIHLIDALTRLPTATPDGATPVTLDRHNPADRDLIAELASACTDDDVDAAELELDSLDPLIVALLAADGSLGAYSSAGPWIDDGQFDDIGVLVNPNCRGLGWGLSAVAKLCARSIEAGRFPIYRCNWDRLASKALCTKLGFRRVSHITAIGPEIPSD
ncbi:MAG: GNAT family N-acetyltransferase [Acidimicrobiales bacterium]